MRFLCLFLFVRLGPWGSNDDDMCGGSSYRARIEIRVVLIGGRREKKMKKKVLQQYRIALGYFYVIILCIHHYYIIIIISSIRATIAVDGGDGQVFISRPRAPVATITR